MTPRSSGRIVGGGGGRDDLCCQLLTALLLLGAATAPAVQPKVGEPARPFSLRTVDGQAVSPENLRGDVGILDFWATGCAPCRKELPLLEGYLVARKDVGLRIFVISPPPPATIAAR